MCFASLNRSHLQPPRSDRCIGPRALVVAESMAAFVLLDHWMLRKTEEFMFGGADLELLRADIDEIDRTLLDLVAERTGLAQDFARVKKEAGLPVIDPKRAQERREFYRKAAGRLGLDPQAAIALADSLMSASVKRQETIRSSPSKTKKSKGRKK